MDSVLFFARTALFELDLVIFLVAGLSTALFNGVLSKNQTHRAHYLADATLWVRFPLLCTPLYFSITIELTVFNFCANRDAQHEFRGHTVSIKVLFFILFAVLSPTIFFLEYFSLAPTRKLRPWRRLLTSLRFAFGILTATALNLVFVEAGKNYVGFPRPSFARTCVGADGFRALSGAALTPVSAQCVASAHDAFESRRSFPSGHASLAVGAAMYMQLYILRAARGRAWIALVSYAPMAMALFVGASRIVDNAHHPADVVAGALLGMWPALTHFWYVERATTELEAAERDVRENGVDGRRAD